MINSAPVQKLETYSEPVQKWRKRNLYYYKDLEKFYCSVVQPKTDVLEVGIGLGELLNAVEPNYGVGIDKSEQTVENSRRNFSHLEFAVKDIEEFAPNQSFDYILLANTISYIGDIQKALRNIHKACTPSTRVVLTYHNPAWELILRLATLLKQRMPFLSLNWLSYQDIENLLSLNGFEVVYRGKRMLFPKQIPLISWFFNSFLAHLPGFNSLCLTEYAIARIRPREDEKQKRIEQMTCSVIVPARNESKNIEGCVTRLPKMGKHTEIIFIEGHSKDDTWSEIQRVQAEYGDRWDIKIAQQSGKGKGDAVRQGFDMATGDVLIILDSDLTVKPEELIYFYEAVASGFCEFANGCRLIYPLNKEAMPWLNQMANRFFAWFLSYLLSTKIKDSLCGTKALTKENYQKIADNRSYFGDFDPFGDFDLLFGAAKLGLHIKDIPVRYVPRTYGSSNIQHVKEGITLFQMCMYAAKKIKFI